MSTALFCVIIYMIFYYPCGFIWHRLINYHFCIKGKKFCLITVKYRRWLENGDMEFHPVSTYKEEWRDELSEEEEMTLLVEDIPTNLYNRVFIAPVNKEGERMSDVFYQSGCFQTAHIPLEQVVKKEVVPVTFWGYMFRGIQTPK